MALIVSRAARSSRRKNCDRHHHSRCQFRIAAASSQFSFTNAAVQPPSLHSLSLRLTNDEHSCVSAVFFGLNKSLDSFVCEGSIEKESGIFYTRASQRESDGEYL